MSSEMWENTQYVKFTENTSSCLLRALNIKLDASFTLNCLFKVIVWLEHSFFLKNIDLDEVDISGSCFKKKKKLF